jgi:hypothetical protein
LPKMCNSASSLNTLYTDKSEQFYSTFLPTTISFNSALTPKTLSLTPFFRPKPAK